MHFSHILIIVLMLATFGVLIAGLFTMLRSDIASKRFSNKLMVARVTLQAITVIAVVLVVLFHKK